MAVATQTVRRAHLRAWAVMVPSRSRRPRKAGAGEGGQGWGAGVGGWGGHDGVGGNGVYGGHGLTGVGGRGGIGGKGADGNAVIFNPAWYNTGATQLTFQSGQGQGGGDNPATCGAGGGGGGGDGFSTIGGPDPGGGGGGGSFAIQSTRSDGNAPTTRQTKPGSTGFRDGFIQRVFDTNPS